MRFPILIIIFECVIPINLFLFDPLGKDCDYHREGELIYLFPHKTVDIKSEDLINGESFGGFPALNK